MGNDLERVVRKPLNTVVVALVAMVAIYVGDMGYQAASNGGLQNVTPGRDIAISLAASNALLRGENIYSSPDSYPGAHAYLNGPGVPPATRGGLDTPDSVQRRPGNPALMFWLLAPLTSLSFRLADLLWTALLLVLMVAALIALLSSLGWRHRMLPALIFVAMPEPFMALWVGNVNVVAFAGLTFAFALAARYPILAGGLLCAAWLKPEQFLPFALLIWLFSPAPRMRMAVGFAAASLIGLGVTAVALGPDSLVQWARSLVTYTSDLGQSDDLSTIMGLAAPRIAGTPKLLLEAALLVAALVFTGLQWLRLRFDRDAVVKSSWLWGLWVLCIPYEHFHDLIVLAIPMFCLVGPDGRDLPSRLRLLFDDGMRGGPAFLAILVAYFAVVPYNLYPVVFTAFDPLPLCVAAITVCLAANRHRRVQSAGPRTTPDPVASY